MSNLYGTPLVPCFGQPQSVAPSCYANASTPYAGQAYVLGAYNIASTSTVADRDNILNLHYGIPHKDGTKDDIQFLGMINYINTNFYESPNDQGGVPYLNAIGVGQPLYIDGYQLNAQPGTLTTGFSPSSVSTYYFPFSSQNRAHVRADSGHAARRPNQQPGDLQAAVHQVAGQQRALQGVRLHLLLQLDAERAQHDVVQLHRLL